jgi:hypothetical protein
MDAITTQQASHDLDGLIDRVIADASGVGGADSLTTTPLLGNEHVTAALHAAASA